MLTERRKEKRAASPSDGTERRIDTVLSLRIPCKRAQPLQNHQKNPKQRCTEHPLHKVHIAARMLLHSETVSKSDPPAASHDSPPRPLLLFSEIMHARRADGSGGSWNATRPRHSVLPRHSIQPRSSHVARVALDRGPWHSRRPGGTRGAGWACVEKNPRGQD